MKNSVGVIGGVGPMATVYFMERVILMTDAKNDQEHLNLLVHQHAAIPDRTAFILGKSKADPRPYLIDDALKLEAEGAKYIVIPCNTAHYFFEEVQKAVSIPVVNIVNATVEYAAEHVPNLTTIGIMATDGTIATDTYQHSAEAHGLKAVIPDENMQKRLMDMIYGGVKAGKPVSKADFMEVVNHLRERGCQIIILGCTELSVLKRDFNLQEKDILDSIDVLAVETVTRSGKKLTQEGQLIADA